MPITSKKPTQTKKTTPTHTKSKQIDMIHVLKDFEKWYDAAKPGDIYQYNPSLQNA